MNNQFGAYGAGGLGSMSSAELMNQSEFRRRKEENAREEAMLVDLLAESSPNYGGYGGGWPGLES